jgi:hypothetical protein
MRTAEIPKHFANITSAPFDVPQGLDGRKLAGSIDDAVQVSEDPLRINASTPKFSATRFCRPALLLKLLAPPELRSTPWTFNDRSRTLYYERQIQHGHISVEQDDLLQQNLPLILHS